MNMEKKGPQRGVKLQPLDIIDGFKVRPGFYNRNGAQRLQTASALRFIHPERRAVRYCCSGRVRRNLTRG